MVMFVAKRQMGYGGSMRVYGEVFEQQNLRNDERLLELKYLAIAPEKSTYPSCDQCGRRFIDESAYDGHFLDVHGPQLPEPAQPTRLEDEYPGGMTLDQKTGRVRAGRAG